MTKKMTAIVLSVMLVFGAGMSVYAADAAESEAAVSESPGLLDALTADVDSEEDMKNLLDGLLGVPATVEAKEAGLLPSPDEDTLKAIAGTVSGALGIKISEDKMNKISALVKDPAAMKQKLAGLFAEGGSGAAVLDQISSKNAVLGGIINSMKSEDGSYDFDKITKIMDGVEEKDGSLVIGGTEIPKDEIKDAAAKAMAAFGLAG